MKLTPQEGGCWYCHKSDQYEQLLFCWEFDTLVHYNCVKKRGEEIEKNNEYDPEWEIIAKEIL